MTRRRGFKERPSKYGEEIPSYFKTGKTTKKDVLVREDPNGKVVDIIYTVGTEVEILSDMDSKWVRISTPGGVIGYAGSAYISKTE